MKILSCSKDYEGKFMSDNAILSVGGTKDSILNHIKKSLRVHNGDKLKIPNKLDDADFFVVEGVEFNISFLPSFVKMLWLKFFHVNSYLYDYLKDYDSIDYGDDVFVKEKQHVFEAVIALNKKQVVDECMEFNYILSRNNLSVFVNESIFDFLHGVLIIPASIDGKREGVLQELIASNYPDISDDYFNKIKQFGFSRTMLGKNISYQLDKNKIVVIIFSLESNDSLLEFKKFKEGISTLKEDSLIKDLDIIVPHKLGLNLSNHEWVNVRSFLEESFISVKYL